MRADLAPRGDESRIFALAELSFLHAERHGRRDQALAAAVYAYAFLFPGSAGTPPDRFDPRRDVARNLYNRGLTLALEPPAQHVVVMEAGPHPLPFGTLDVAVDEGSLDWAGLRLGNFVPAAELEVRGLRNRYRWPGLGVPIAPIPGAPPPPGFQHIPDRLKVPVTAFLRIDDAREHLRDARLHGTLAVYSAEGARPVLDVDGSPVPLERETSSSLASMLEGAPIWDFDLAGFRSGDFLPLPETKSQLVFLRPHRPGRIPVVFVHGTASNPARWAEMVNELDNDPRIAARYEFWLFLYNSGSPIAYSGGLLVASLQNTVRELDPTGADPGLRKMVVIGHSQGGLLTKLTAIDSGTRFWDRLSSKPLGDLTLSPDSRRLLEQSLFYKPLPFVRRAVFIATPHRGSFLTTWSPAHWITRLIKAPLALTRLSSDLIANPDAFAARSLRRMPTSLDNMNPSNPFLRELSEIPVDPRITAHSIVAVKGTGPPELGNDGVVEYKSAHIDGVESELVVRSGHSTQARPETINEVRRILLENAESP
jgi:pimeloyl-ACP methyl ester carboxylesterase